jgi:hypothetical protein
MREQENRNSCYFCEGKGTAPASLEGKIPILPSKGENRGDRNDSNIRVRKDSNRQPKKSEAEGHHRKGENKPSPRYSQIMRRSVSD